MCYYVLGPLFLTHEDHLEDTEPSAGNILPGEETDHSSDGVEVIARLAANQSYVSVY